MVHITINVDKDIYYTKEFYEIRKDRQISKLVNDFLREHFQIKENEIDSELLKIQEERERLEVRENALKAQKDEEIRKKVEESTKWTRIL